MVDLDDARPPAEPRPSATILLVRDGERALEVCVMQRSHHASFLGGAIVFPGGQVDPSDAPSGWPAAIAPRPLGPWSDEPSLSARIAACRESLEEVGLAPVRGARSQHDFDVLREALRAGVASFQQALVARGCSLDLEALVPFSRWVTPTAQARRFDARFFLAMAPRHAEPAIDPSEAARAFFASPAQLLSEFDEGTISLVPPTHRMLQILANVGSVRDAMAGASKACLEIVQPRFLVDDGVPTLALPGDRLHEVREKRVPGGTRYVLRDGRWVCDLTSA